MTRAKLTDSPFLTIDGPVFQALENRHIVVTGGTGLIGQQLVERLLRAKARVTLLTRDPMRVQASLPLPGATALLYDAQDETPLSPRVRNVVRTADAVINLAGESIESQRWTPARKRVLQASRIVGTRKLVATIADATGARPAFISVSAVGYYGTSETATFTEEAESGTDFLAETAFAWEQAALRNAHRSRTVILRLGVVLSSRGGALSKMTPAFRAFLGGAPGSGRQWFSWVHIDDAVRLLLHAAVDDKWKGVYNATAPQPVRLDTFCTQLGRVLSRPNWLPVPKQAVRMMLGNEAAQLVLAGQQVLPKRTRANGFVYQYKDVGSALENLLVEDNDDKS